ncbi:uncharacterized protein BDV14DRAFT_42529 [Aspergillus stella-maris]|uniref:uncharacterized protein n=1 Tax=Aspergillus stella-maris TaxID=1810926 RepID=UPI003CCDC929
MWLTTALCLRYQSRGLTILLFLLILFFGLITQTFNLKRQGQWKLLRLKQSRDLRSPFGPSAGLWSLQLTPRLRTSAKKSKVHRTGRCHLIQLCAVHGSEVTDSDTDATLTADLFRFRSWFWLRSLFCLCWLLRCLAWL